MVRVNRIQLAVWSVFFLVMAGCGGGGGGSYTDSGGNGGGNQVSLADGGTVAASDGANVTLPADYGRAPVTVALSKTSSASGIVSDDRKTVSGEYALTIAGAEALTSNLTISIPLDPASLPQGWTADDLRPEVLNPVTGQWELAGRFVLHDSATGRATFDVSPAEQLAAASSSAKSLHASPVQYQRVYRIRVYLFSSALTVRRPGSAFRITYYPASLNKPYSVMTDARWDSDTGNAIDPAVPDFVEDLDQALNDAYDAMLALRKTGGALFNALDEPHDVEIIDLGGDAGNVPYLGGTLQISSSKITSYRDMRSVAAHELVHVLQGQYYSNVVNSIYDINRWFIDATANHLAARALDMDDAWRREFYTGDGYQQYLNVPLTTFSDQSMYTAAHFLDWITSTYGDTIVADAVSGASTDMTNLSNAIKSAGEAGGISSAYEKYGAYMMTHPYSDGGLVLYLKTSLYNENMYINSTISAGRFTNTATFITFKKVMKPLTMALVQLPAGNSSDAMLVVGSSRSTGSLVSSYSYDFIGTSDSAYTGALAIDRNNQLPSQYPLTVKHFGTSRAAKALDQLIVNSSTASSAGMDVDYYILQPPVVKQVQAGGVLWSTAEVGNIPRNRLKGYNIYRSNGSSYEKLNNSPVPLPDSGTEQGYTDGMIQAGDNVIVQIEDSFGNKWPEVSFTTALPNKCSIDLKAESASFFKTDGGSTSTEPFLNYTQHIYPFAVGTYDGSIYTVMWNQFEDGSQYSGAMNYSLDANRTKILYFSGSSLQENSLFTQQITLEGANLPYARTSSDGDEVVFEVTGTAACSHLTQSVDNSNIFATYATPVRTSELVSVQCGSSSYLRIRCVR